MESERRSTSSSDNEEREREKRRIHSCPQYSCGSLANLDENLLDISRLFRVSGVEERETSRDIVWMHGVRARDYSVVTIFVCRFIFELKETISSTSSRSKQIFRHNDHVHSLT